MVDYILEFFDLRKPLPQTLSKMALGQAARVKVCSLIMINLLKKVI